MNAAFQKAFRHLGDERDFDHGHVLHAPGGRPVAILYHTQELALYHKRDAPFGYIDPKGRNWIQWIDEGRIENANKYVRRAYPDSARWRLFEKNELPGLLRHKTVTDRMLDPALLGVEISASRQWVFTRVSCPADGSPSVIGVVLPDTRERVCLSLSAS